MASSTLSLDSLSSPSPSPPPPPAKVAQLDPDSELSELTDDDQDASDAVDKRAPSSVKEDTHPAPSTSTSKSSRRGAHQRSSSRRGGAVGRKKRSSIVPAPMWGWAENKTASTSTAAAPVEEEEEEISGPPRAMEEEEEEEEDEEPEDADFGINEDVESGRAYGPHRRMAPYISQRYHRISSYLPARHWVQQRPRRARKGWRQPGEEPKEDGEAETSDLKPNDPHDTNNKNSAAAINSGDDDDEGSASGSPYPSTSRKKRSAKQRAAPVSSSSSAALRKRKETGGDDHHSGSERLVHPLKKKKNEDNNKLQCDEDEEVSDVPVLSSPPPPPQAASDNENTESEEEPFVLPPAVASPLIAKLASPTTTIITMNGNTAEAMSALTALAAAAADSIDIMAPIGGDTKGKGGDKNTGVIANDTEPSNSTASNATSKKAPPTYLSLNIDTRLDEQPSLPVVDTTVEDDVNDRSLYDREDVDMDDPEEEEEEEEEEEVEEEEEADELEEEQADEEPNEVDEEAVDPEGDEDQEQDGADNENEDMEEGENGDENENDEEPSPDGDEHEESDLQPAHRAEALDVLATIELKFALLRERLYVEKMEGLAWEERMVQASAHPEMQHLQKELTKRRDKRLELASRKRSYEVTNASKRRRADEDGVWSWWKFARDELQTDMISETNRKRRRLERERRAIERPQPIRRIPLSDMHNPPPLPPTLRKIVKSYPFGSRKQNKSEGHSHHHNQYPKAHYVYPEISTLSAVDIAKDLDFLDQNRRMSMGMATSVVPGGYEVQQQQQQHQIQQPQYYGPQQQQLYNTHQQQPVPQRNVAMMGIGMGGIGRTINNVGIGLSNEVLLPQVQSQVQQQQPQASQMGPPPSNNSMMHSHPHLHQPPPQQQHSVAVGYERQFVGDMPPFGPSGVSARMREPQPMNMNSYQQQPHGLPPLGHPPPPPSQPPTTTKARDASYPAYSGGPGPGGRMHQSSHGPPLPMSSSHSHSHGYGKDHEKGQGPGGPGSGPSNNGPGHHHHTYFGQGSSSGGGGGGSAYGPSSSSSHIPGNGMNGRRSISPVHVMSNGSGGGKPNGMWMSGYHPGNGGGKGGEWGGEWGDEDREMLVREREREREKERDRDRERERERERARHRDRDRDREHQEHERERQRDHQHIQQQHRQPPLSHLHGGGAPAPQGPGVIPHHHVVSSHHQHRPPPPHHHHVLHNHHGHGQSHTSTSLPPGSVGSASIVHSPRSTRDYDSSRPPPQLHPGPGQPHSSEVILLSSGSKSSSQPQLHPRDRDRESWSGKGPDEPHHNPAPSALEYRERDHDHMIREMDNRKMHSRRPSSGPPMLSLEERDRPMTMPFVMPPSHSMQQASSHLGSSGPGTSPRGVPPSWPTSSSYDDAPRILSSSSAPGYLNSPHAHDTRVRSPIQGHRYAPPNSTGSGMGRHITTGASSSSSSSSGLHHMISTPPPSRTRPPPSPSYSNSLSKSHRSPVVSPRIRPLSPPAPSNPSSKLLSALPTGSGYSSSPRLSGPGRTSTPTGLHPSSIPTHTPSNQTDIITKNGTQPPPPPSSSYPISSRNTSPLMSSLHAPLSSSLVSGRPPASGMDRDRDRDRHSTAMGLSPRLGSSHPPPPLSKMSTAQTVDGH